MGLYKKKKKKNTIWDFTEFPGIMLHWTHLMNKANALQGAKVSKEPCEQKATLSLSLSGNRSEQWRKATKNNGYYIFGAFKYLHFNN